MTVASGSTVRDLEQEKFVDTAAAETAVRVIVTDLELINPDITVETEPSNTGATTLKTDLSTSEFEITSATGQQDIVVTNLSSGRVHFSLTTGVSTSNAFLSKGDQLDTRDYSGSIFVIRNTGTGTIQIDKRSLT